MPDRVRRQVEFQPQADDVLLHAVVEVALDPLPFGVRGLDETERDAASCRFDSVRSASRRVA